MSTQLLSGIGITNSPEILVVSAAATLNAGDQLVQINTGDGAYSLTLPYVADAIGTLFSLHKIDASTNACTLQDQDDSEGWSDLTIDALDDDVVLFCNGRAWQVIFNGIV